MPDTTCISCRAESHNPDDVPHEPWCALFMRPVESPQLDIFAARDAAGLALFSEILDAAIGPRP